MRLRWLKSFAMPERLAVIQRFRGHGIGALLLERCRAMAAARGGSLLYVRVLPAGVGYWERLGWRRLDPPEASDPARRMVALIKPADPSKPLSEIEPPEDLTLLPDRPAGGVTR